MSCAILPAPRSATLMARPLIVDGRNLLDPAEVRAAGFAYEGSAGPSRRAMSLRRHLSATKS